MRKASVITFLSLFLLAGCGLIPLSASEKSYVDDCKKVQANLKEYMKIQDKFYDAEYDDPEYDWKSWPETYAVSNAGQISRNTAISSLKSNFPWINSITQNYFQNIGREEFLTKSPDEWNSGELESSLFQNFYQMLAFGTSFKVTADALDNAEYISAIDFNNVYGSFAPNDKFMNCDDALGLTEEDDNSFHALSNDYGIYGSKGARVPSVLSVSISLWGCETFGVGYADYGKGWEKCAGSDFTYVYTPSNEVTEEERAILAERGEAAQREALEPSIPTSNVTPLQLCNSLGQVVQSSNYGQLTCKFVLINRVRTLAWMRS